MDIKYIDLKSIKLSKESEFEALRMKNFRNEIVKRMKALDEMRFRMEEASYSDELQQQIMNEAHELVDQEYAGVSKDDY